MPCYQHQSSKAPDNEFGFGYVGPNPIEWRAKEHAKCMASNSFAEAEAWLSEISRELKIARHWLAAAQSVAAQGGVK